MVEFLGYLGSLGLSCYAFLCLFPLTLTLQNFNGFPNFVLDPDLVKLVIPLCFVV